MYCYLLNFDGLVFPSFESIVTEILQKRGISRSAGEILDLLSLEDLFSGRITPFTFGKKMYIGREPGFGGLPHLHRLRSEHLKKLRIKKTNIRQFREIRNLWNVQNDVPGAKRTDNGLICLGGNAPPWVGNILGGELDEVFDYIFLSYEMGSLAHTEEYRLKIVETLSRLGYDSIEPVFITVEKSSLLFPEPAWSRIVTE